jgi:hypothetical protein
MDQSQSASDYKEYFSNKFISLFSQLISRIIDLLPNGCEDKNNLEKIKNIGNKLNYDKIIKKMEENKKLVDILNLLSKNESDDKTYYLFFKNKEKYWTILPSFNINTIALQIPDRKIHVELFGRINDLHVCAVTYAKVIEQINACSTEGKEFNPFDSIGNVASNMDIETLFNGVEVKNISAYDMIMSQIINQETNNKMDEYMNNIKESDVHEAASKLNDVLESDNFNGNKQTSKLLSEMLSNIKDEVIGLKNNTNSNNMQGKQGVEQLLGIAQKVAGNMMGKIKDSDVSVLEIWDATSSLAKNTVQSDALNIVDNLIRSNIVANINGKGQNQDQNQTQNQEQNPTKNHNQESGNKSNKDRKSKKKIGIFKNK